MTHRCHVLLCLVVLFSTNYDAVVNGFSIPSSSTTTAAAAARRGAASSSKSLLKTTARSSSSSSYSSSSSSSSWLIVSMSSSSSTTADQTSSTGSSSFSYRSLFNFSNVDEKAVDKFERIDDAVRTDLDEKERRAKKWMWMDLLASFDAVLIYSCTTHTIIPCLFCRSVMNEWYGPLIHTSTDGSRSWVGSV